MKEVVINGKFMSQKITGVQRCAREILSELDKLLSDDIHVILAVDANAKNVPCYYNIEVRQIGKITGTLWEQITLPNFVKKRKAICSSLCNASPLLTPNIVIIHDVSFKINPSYYSKKLYLWYNLIFALTIKRIKKIITVSEFSKKEIVKCYHIDPNRITVIYNSWQHMDRIEASNNTFEKYNSLRSGNYYFSMSTLAANKNFKWILNVAKNNPDEVFAIAGGGKLKGAAEAEGFVNLPNIHFLGYVSDEDAKTLMANCKAFLFPTLYEGFGLPPLEAIACGCKKIVVSDTPCMHEIYGDCAEYVDPYNPNVDLDKLISESVADSSKILDKYSWHESARLLLRVISND